MKLERTYQHDGTVYTELVVVVVVVVVAVVGDDGCHREKDESSRI